MAKSEVIINSEDGTCCPDGQALCNGVCCASGTSCCNGTCCDKDHFCCGDMCCPWNVEFPKCCINDKGQRTCCHGNKPDCWFGSCTKL